MRTTKEGNIMIEVEGTHSMIEKLMKNLDHNLFVCPCQNELVWLPFANKYRGFFANAFVASESPPCDKRKT
jgi:hypothetical protein